MITRLTLPKYMLQKDFQIPDALAKCILEGMV
ncbi:unnamed protein product [Anisakis simplex]|uniref:Transposase n=1 Tax=Anisakis simplex TaxID=6269 RepID=A0A0M3JJW8_ANISI|nr:unnamed protein product [Anisakis simplex]